MDLSKLIEEITNNPSLNFIGFATTPWHVHGLMAAIYKIRETGEVLNGTIFITPHSQTGYAIDGSFFPTIEGIKIETFQKTESLNIRIMKVIDSLYYLTYIRRRGKDYRKIYIVEPWTINSALSGALIRKNRNLRLTHIVYDEGVSTYFPIKYKSTNIPTFIYNQYLKYIVFGFGYKYLSSKSNFILAKLFAETKRGLVENKAILPYYLKALSESPKRWQESIDFSENSVIICTTAWDRAEIKENEDVKLIKSTERILRDMGLSVWFKPHPRDKNFNILYPDVNVLDSSLSIEGILLNCKIKPKAMISISSTILVTSKLFFGIDVIDLSKILDETKIGRYLDEISSFQKVFGNYVPEPKNIEELRACIK